MASSTRSIGSLVIDIEARTAKLETDMARAKAIIDKSTGSVKEMSDATTKLRDHQNVMLNQLTQRLAGMLALFTLIKSEVSHVYNNIEKIPGINPVALGSILQMKEDLSDVRRDIDQFIAGGISGFAEFGRMVGVTAGAIFETFANPRVGDVLEQIAEKIEQVDLVGRKSANELAKMKDPGFEDKVRQKEEQLYELKLRAIRATMSHADAIKSYRREAELNRISDLTGGQDDLKRAERRKQAFESDEQANRIERQMKEELTKAQEKVNNSMERGAIATLSARERLDALQQITWRLRNEIAALSGAYEKTKDPTILQTLIDKTKKLGDVQDRLNTATKAYGEFGRLLGTSIADNLGRAVLEGQKLNDMLRNILGSILQIVLQRTIIGPLADLLGAGITKIPGIGGHAMGGPISGATIVGEKGPELLVGAGYGTVIPNEQLRGGKSGNTYYIDATGADAAAISRLESSLMALAGPGVVERRSLSATINASRRRGSLGGALAGA